MYDRNLCPFYGTDKCEGNEDCPHVKNGKYEIKRERIKIFL